MPFFFSQEKNPHATNIKYQREYTIICIKSVVPNQSLRGSTEQPSIKLYKVANLFCSCIHANG